MYRHQKNREPELTADQVISLIEREDIQVVSFDLFDTLLVRPSIVPKDVFVLLQDIVKKEFDLDFLKLRSSAEEDAKDSFISLDELWSFIAKRNRLDLNTALQLEQLEMQLERDMLTVRRDTKRIYEAAVHCGKRIIVISDMYLPGDFLLDVLREKGFGKVERVYVSCEEKARKSDGEIYARVLEQEGLEDPSALLHIGDSFDSDYKKALEQGVSAVYYPSVWDLTMSSDSPWGKALRNKGISPDPKLRILFSFAFLHAWNKNDRLLYGTRCFQDEEMFADLLLAPMLTGLGIELLCDPSVQKEYSEVLFAARDGFLPQKVYDTLGKNREHIPSRYLYASRQALCYAAFHSFVDYFEHSRWEGSEYALEDFLSVFVTDPSIRDGILKQLSDTERRANLCASPVGALRILRRFSEELESYFARQKELSKTYYQSLLGPGEGSRIIFDCGYSGSVSVGLNQATGLSFDKYYLWETKENRCQDKKNATKTVCFFSGEPLLGINIIFEECFSPLEGSCLGFANHQGTVEPVLEDFAFKPEMCRTMETLETNCVSFAEDFEKVFRPYLPAMRADHYELFLDIARYAFIESPYNELSIFDNIVFPDSHGPRLSLSKKTYENFTMLRYYLNSFHGTMFENPDTIKKLDDCIVKPEPGYRVGIHFHLFNKYLLEEVLGYLKTVTYPFDLFVTITDPLIEPVLEKLYTRSMIPMLQNIRIIPTKNRGRDVAPWLVEMSPYQDQYDIFCHIHSKESSQYGEGFGQQWRQYLFDNLIDGDALNKIITLFQSDEKLGLVFPTCYSKIKSTHNDLNIPVSGDFGEEVIIRELLDKMGVEEYFTRDDFIWSMGTMMWYRPKAMAPLFDLGLKFEDFPKEPIGVGGTIAHAIERITYAVVKGTGYTVGQFNHVEEANMSSVNMTGIVYPGWDRSPDQIAWRIGFKNAIKVVWHAHMIFVGKALGLIKGEVPKWDSYVPYDIARSLGVKNAWIILRKTAGILIVKK